MGNMIATMVLGVANTLGQQHGTTMLQWDSSEHGAANTMGQHGKHGVVSTLGQQYGKQGATSTW